jgi:hypothetical protein
MSAQIMLYEMTFHPRPCVDPPMVSLEQTARKEKRGPE